MMRRSSTRKTGSQNSASSMNSSPVDLFRSASSKAIVKELERIDQIFNSYMNKSSGMIDPEGIEALCSDLEVDHTDVRVLMLAWKMKAEKQGYFTLDEWRRGLKALRADTVNKLKKALPELEKEVRRPLNFVDFYAYAFRYCLTEEKQKSIDIDSICELLHLVLGSQFHAQVDLLIKYLKVNDQFLLKWLLKLYCLLSPESNLQVYIIKLEERLDPVGNSSSQIQSDYKVINMDQWMGFLRFCNEISFPDLSNYDPDLAWPLILDNFVEWMRERQS